MIDPSVLPTRIWPKIIKFRYSLDMVKDDWPPQGLMTRISPKIIKVWFSLDMVKDDWPASIADQNVT